MNELSIQHLKKEWLRLSYQNSIDTDGKCMNIFRYNNETFEYLFSLNNEPHYIFLMEKSPVKDNYNPTTHFLICMWNSETDVCLMFIEPYSKYI